MIVYLVFDYSGSFVTATNNPSQVNIYRNAGFTVLTVQAMPG